VNGTRASHSPAETGEAPRERPPGRGSGPIVAGIDLAGSPRRTTGVCRMDGTLTCSVGVAHTDAEIWQFVANGDPDLISVDAPLSIPRGRRSIGDRHGPHFRACDLALRARSIRFFPVTLGPMRMLTRRGMRLQRRFARAGIPTVESYPGAAQDLLRIPRKQAGVDALTLGLRALGVRGELERTDLGHDELDAITCAVVGLLWLGGLGELVGDPAEGLMALPLARLRSAGLRSRLSRRLATASHWERRLGELRTPMPRA
jgi:uncharacterized protein